jgi:hypothetical protein
MRSKNILILRKAKFHQRDHRNAQVHPVIRESETVAVFSKAHSNTTFFKPSLAFSKRSTHTAHLILREIKVKLSRYHHADKGERNYSSYSFLTLAIDWVSGQHYPPSALYQRERTTIYPLDRRLGGPQSWTGQRG